MEERTELKPDYSTIDREALAKLPTAKLAPTYRLQDQPGNGCYLDPPGYPTYYTRSVYTQYGNNPARGATMLLLGHVVQRAASYDHEAQQGLMRRLYLPLPYDHPRVDAWERSLYAHFGHCYRDTLGLFPQEYGRPAIVIYPVPGYKLKAFRDDPRFSDEWRAKERAAIAQANAEIEAQHQAVCVPANHMAVIQVREIYPEAPIRHDWITNPPERIGNWWERLGQRPTPEQCPGDRSVRFPHRADGWCQFCGYGA